jgi:hypothetical protein
VKKLFRTLDLKRPPKWFPQNRTGALPRNIYTAFNETPTKGIVMDKIALAKKIAKPVVMISTSFAVGGLLKNNVATKNKLQEVELLIAAGIVGGMVAELAEEYTMRTIDNVVAAWNEFKQNNP